MRVTFILPAFYAQPIGGYRVVFEYCNYLARHGVHTSVLFPRSLAPVKSRCDAFQRSFWRILKHADYRSPISWMSIEPSVDLRFVATINDRSVPDGDAVFATGWETASAVSALPKSKGEGFYLVQDYEHWNGAPEALIDKTFRLGLKTVAVSAWLADLVKARGGVEVRHIPNAVDHSTFKVRRAVGSRRDVLSLYHTEWRKGVEIAIEAMSLAKRERPKTTFGMFGTTARPSTLPQWISYARCPTGPSLAELYNGYDVFLSASYVEGWGLPPAEAMACGCLFIGTDSKGVRDFAENDKSALLSNPGDPMVLSRNLIRGLLGGSDIAQMRARGLSDVQQLTWDRSGEELLRYLVEVTNR